MQPSVNLKLRPKLFAELKPGSRVVSHDFDMGDWKPDKTADLDGHKIYFWVIPADAKNVIQLGLGLGDRSTG